MRKHVVSPTVNFGAMATAICWVSVDAMILGSKTALFQREMPGRCEYYEEQTHKKTERETLHFVVREKG